MVLTRLPEPVSTTYVPYRGVCIRTKGVKRYPVNRSRKGTEGMRQKEKKKTRKALYGDVRNGREMVARVPVKRVVNGSGR